MPPAAIGNELDLAADTLVGETEAQVSGRHETSGPVRPFDETDGGTVEIFVKPSIPKLSRLIEPIKIKVITV